MSDLVIFLVINAVVATKPAVTRIFVSNDTGRKSQDNEDQGWSPNSPQRASDICSFQASSVSSTPSVGR